LEEYKLFREIFLFKELLKLIKSEQKPLWENLYLVLILPNIQISTP